MESVCSKIVQLKAAPASAAAVFIVQKETDVQLKGWTWRKSGLIGGRRCKSDCKDVGNM